LNNFLFFIVAMVREESDRLLGVVTSQQGAFLHRARDEEKQYLLDEKRWIGQLNEAYHQVVTDPAYGHNALDEANEAITEAIRKIEGIRKNA
jgi:hypothetical protein